MRRRSSTYAVRNRRHALSWPASNHLAAFIAFIASPDQSDLPMPAENTAHMLRNTGFARPADASANAAAAPATSPQAGAVDYEVIYAAVTGNERGRWFLSEYARRNRAADTEAVLDAIGRLAGSGYSRGATPPTERSPVEPSRDEPLTSAAFADTGRLRAELAGMADAIARIKSRLPPGSPESMVFNDLSSEGPFAALAMTKYLGAIMDTAEQVQDVAWTMRRQSAAAALCDRLDFCAGEILAACTQLDVARRSVREIVNVLRYLDVRLHALTDARSEPAAPATPTVPLVPDISATPNAPAEAAAAAMPIAPAESVADGASTMLAGPAIPLGPALPITPALADVPPVPAPAAPARDAEPSAAPIASPLSDTGLLVFLALRETGKAEIGRPDRVDDIPVPGPEPAAGDKPSGSGPGEAANDAPATAQAEKAGCTGCHPVPAPLSDVAQNIPAAVATMPPARAFEEMAGSSPPVQPATTDFTSDGPAKSTGQPATGQPATGPATGQPASCPALVAEVPAMVPTVPAITAPVAAATAQPMAGLEILKGIREARTEPATMPPATAMNPDPDFAALFADVMALSEEERVALFT
jgi:hypothetical protein